MPLDSVVELDEIADYLAKRELTDQYLKAVKYLLSGNTCLVDFKKRKPKKDEIWQFRITRKYRAYCYFSGKTLVVFEINDHQ